MTLPSSGPISLSQIANEFGLSITTPFPSGFYNLPGGPTGGAASFASFYGLSNVVFTPNGGLVTDSRRAGSTITLTCSRPAVWTFNQTSGEVGPNNNVGGFVSGGTYTSITFNCNNPGPVGTRPYNSASWSVTGSSNGVVRNFTLQLEAFGDI